MGAGLQADVEPGGGWTGHGVLDTIGTHVELCTVTLVGDHDDTSAGTGLSRRGSCSGGSMFADGDSGVKHGTLCTLMAIGHAIAALEEAPLIGGVGVVGGLIFWTKISTLIGVAVDGPVLEVLSVTVGSPEGRGGVGTGPGAVLILFASSTKDTALIQVLPLFPVRPATVNWAGMSVTVPLRSVPDISVTVLASVGWGGVGARPVSGLELGSSSTCSSARAVVCPRAVVTPSTINWTGMSVTVPLRSFPDISVTLLASVGWGGVGARPVSGLELGSSSTCSSARAVVCPRAVVTPSTINWTWVGVALPAISISCLPCARASAISWGGVSA